MGRSGSLKKILAKRGIVDKDTPLGFDLIGDIMIVKSPVWIVSRDTSYFKKIGEEIIRLLPYVKSVWLSVSPVQGEYRLRRLYHLAGEKRTTTIYKEHGCLFKVDISSAYISPRLSYEHLRIARLVGEGEAVVNLFSGVGGFSIIIAKHSRAQIVYSVEMNPAAYRLLQENIRLNGLEGKVKAYFGDARRVSENILRSRGDRILLPLSHMDESHYKAALMTIKGDSGIMHVYDFCQVKGGRKNAITVFYNRVKNMIEKLGWKPILTGGRVVRSVGPREYQVALDLKVTKKEGYKSTF